MSYLYSDSNIYKTTVRFQFTRNHMQQSRLTGTITANNADTIVSQQIIGEIFHDRPAIKGLADTVELDNFFTQTAGCRRHLYGIICLRSVLIQQIMVAFDAIFGLGAAGSAATHNPFPLHPQNGLALALAGLCHFFPQFFQLQIFGVVGLIVIDLSPGKLRDMVYHSFQEIAVVSDHYQAAFETAQPVFQPSYHLTVQMVGRLVHHQNICRVYQGSHQRNALALTAGQGSDFLFKVGQSKLHQHGLGFIFIQRTKFFREMQEYLLQNGGIVIHHRILGKIAHLHIGIAGNAAFVRFDNACQHLQERRLTGTVDTDDTGLISLV